MKKTRRGKIDISELNVPPEKHEYETAKYFANRGLDVVFIGPRYIKGMNNPDFKLAGKIWETKCPMGRSKRTFEDNLRKAAKQSRHVIIDLRRIDSALEKWCISKMKEQGDTLRIKTLLSITRDGRLLTIKGKFDSI